MAKRIDTEALLNFGIEDDFQDGISGVQKRLQHDSGEVEHDGRKGRFRVFRRHLIDCQLERVRRYEL